MLFSPWQCGKVARSLESTLLVPETADAPANPRKMSNLRSQVLSSFKNLHNARKAVFKGHTEGLIAGRQKINEEFKKHKQETDTSNIEKLIRVANETAEYLRTSVVQAVYNEDRDAYEVKITKDTYMIENVPFNENWKPDRQNRRKQSKCDQTDKS